MLLHNYVQHEKCLPSVTKIYELLLLHNYVQHEKCLPSVTKNYELYYSLKMVD
jgi:hypothetical protein